MPEPLNEAQARALVLQALGRMRVPSGDELDAILTRYDRELELGFALAFYWESDRVDVRVCGPQEARELPELGGQADDMWFLLGVYEGGRLFDGDWRRDVNGMPENALLVVEAHGPGARRECTLFQDGRRVLLEDSRGGEPRTEVYLEADRPLTLAEVLEGDRSVLDLPAAGVVRIECDDPDVVVPLIRLIVSLPGDEAGPLDLSINGVPYPVSDFAVSRPPTSLKAAGGRSARSGDWVRRYGCGRSA